MNFEKYFPVLLIYRHPYSFHIKFPTSNDESVQGFYRRIFDDITIKSNHLNVLISMIDKVIEGSKLPNNIVLTNCSTSYHVNQEAATQADETYN